jgi:hypothetical protein
MNPSKFPKNPTAPWRVMVPKKWSPSGKRWPHYFKTEALAAEFCRTVKRRGVSTFDKDERARGTAPVLTSHQEDGWKSAIHILTKELGSDVSLLYQAVAHWKATRINVKGGPIEEVVENFLTASRKNKDGKEISAITRKEDRSRLKTLTEYYPQKEITLFTEAMMREYFDDLKGNHRSIYKTVNLFFGWAYARNYLAHNPMEKIKPIGEFGVNNDYYEIDVFQRMLQISAGLLDPKGEVEPTDEFNALLPFFILGGFGGLRPSEAAKQRKDREAVRWTDLHFDADIPCIGIRYEVSKTGKVGQTQWVDKPYAIEAIRAWLPLVRHSNPDFITPIGNAAIGELKKRFGKVTGIKFHDDGLRNSAATYGLAYDGREGAGSIAKWLRNSEKVLLENYVRPLPTGSGQKWFNLRPQTAFNETQKSVPTEKAA